MPKITLEQLARMVAKGFNETTSRFNTLDDKIASLENTLTAEVNRLDIRLDQMAPNFDVKDLNKRVTKIEKQINH